MACSPFVPFILYHLALRIWSCTTVAVMERITLPTANHIVKTMIEVRPILVGSAHHCRSTGVIPLAVKSMQVSQHVEHNPAGYGMLGLLAPSSDEPLLGGCPADI